MSQSHVTLTARSPLARLLLAVLAFLLWLAFIVVVIVAFIPRAGD